MAITESPGAAVSSEVLRVNEPLRVGGVSVYLAGNGYAPRFTVRDGTGAVAFSDQVPFLAQDGFYASSGVIKVPDAADTQIGVVADLYPTYLMTEQGPRSVFPDARAPAVLLTAFTGDLGLDGGDPQNAYVLDTDAMTQLQGEDGGPFRALLRPGQTIDLPDGAGSITLDSVDRFVGLTLRADPARGAALVFSLLAIAGLMASLFVPRRRVWVRAVERSDGSGVRLEVGALARSEDHGLGAETDRVLAEVLAAAGSSDARSTDERNDHDPRGADRSSRNDARSSR